MTMGARGNDGRCSQHPNGRVPDHSFVLTPAESNVAISLRMAAAALMMGHARSAPVPSPSRMSRSRRGSAFRAWSMASWPRSPERWA